MSRQEKINKAIKKEISSIIHGELKDPRLGFITVTKVELTPDLRLAKVFFSVLGQNQDYQKTRQALDSALGFIRRLIAQRIRLRFAPELIFKEDRSSEHSVKIQEILDEIKKSNESKKGNSLYKRQ
ncbi:MAG: 30S ribosome-binding factor RbfA [Candidatus Omnitrophica bacterium]|nr:30S ribosome-binding factor RbfA [Candidatus Omnitrophota bacterium]MBU4346145.1 30S ribosome-binding factor RbfA [Candidatus Omnitrophota bacterium]MBU4473594.1 30S ribosome-binding factor RbfA [Candidatus Omnitrophota bacterium]MCG2706311.1 30S ribosome-binding factor RbfA [Candidatus Omnitrophota bacterium]